MVNATTSTRIVTARADPVSPWVSEDLNERKPIGNTRCRLKPRHAAARKTDKNGRRVTPFFRDDSSKDPVPTVRIVPQHVAARSTVHPEIAIGIIDDLNCHGHSELTPV